MAVRSAVLAALVLVGAALAVGALWREAPLAPADRPIEVTHGGYVTSARCAACHPRQYETWRASYHRTMTQVATPESVAAPFDGREHRHRGRLFRMLRRGDEFFVEMDDPGAGEGSGRTQRPIVLTTGSHHLQYYWFATGEGRKLGLAHMAYLIRDGRWIPADHSGITHPDSSQASLEGRGRWNQNCNRCHSTGPLPRVRGVGSMDTWVAEFGIACEACHGPGEQHVLANRSPPRRYGLHWSDAGDPTIVQPARLDKSRAAQVCGQCHSVNAFHSRRDQLRWARYGPPYRPGDLLTESRRIVHRDGEAHDARETRFWPDGVPRVNGREYNSLIATPCFQRGDMTCLSCHQMHPGPGEHSSLAEWADDQLAPGMRTSQACLQCHADFAEPERLVAHTHHPAASPGSDCQNCHMPNNVYGLQKATRSHRVDGPSAAESRDEGRPNACNLCHLDRTLAWTAETLEAWYGTEAPSLDEDDRQVAASVLWALRGDAGVRALAAWNLAWAPGREASGSHWQVPVLAQMLDDPYPAIRAIAIRSLRSFEGFENLALDSEAPEAKRRHARDEILRLWEDPAPLSPDRQAALLLDENGRHAQSRAADLRAQRDDRPLFLAE